MRQQFVNSTEPPGDGGLKFCCVLCVEKGAVLDKIPRSRVRHEIWGNGGWLKSKLSDENAKDFFAMLPHKNTSGLSRNF